MDVLRTVIILIDVAVIYNMDKKTLVKMKADLEERHGGANVSCRLLCYKRL